MIQDLIYCPGCKTGKSRDNTTTEQVCLECGNGWVEEKVTVPNTKEVEQMKTAEEILQPYVRRVKDGFYMKPMVTESDALEAMKVYALSNPLEQSEPFGYVFEGKFYKEVPERTFFEGNEPVAVYLSREQ